MNDRHVVSEAELVKLIKRHARVGTDAQKVVSAFLSVYGSKVTRTEEFRQAAAHGHIHEWERKELYIAGSPSSAEVCKTCGRHRQ